MSSNVGSPFLSVERREKSGVERREANISGVERRGPTLYPPPVIILTKVSLGGHLSQMQKEMLDGILHVEIIGKQGVGGTLFPKISQKSSFDKT